MVQEIKGTSEAQNSALLSETRKAKTSKSDTDVREDYKLSINKAIVSTLTYSQTGRIGSDNASGSTDLRDLVAKMLQRQGVTWDAAASGQSVAVDGLTQSDAQALIADDGYWGVDQTSERIFQMAVANAGGDTQKIDQIKAAIQKGFDMAKEAFGGSLPDISSKTYDAVMAKLDKWINGESTTV